MKIRMSLLVLSMIFSYGCVSFFPKTAEEFKDNPAFLRHIDDTYTVNRSFAGVMKSIEERAFSCYTGWLGGWDDELIPTYHEKGIRYTGKLANHGNDSATFSVQKLKVNETYFGGVDEDGVFVYVADIKADGESRTVIESYRALFFYDDIAETVKAWANGENVECPLDLVSRRASQ